MKGDFSRVTNRNARDKHYSGVLAQQGRVQLDADLNELQAILRYRDQIEAGDVIGRCGTPKHNPGFEISAAGNSLSVAAGRYYVDGLLCENDETVDFDDQPDLENASDVAALLAGNNVAQVMLYLDAWHRHITTLDDDLIREVALGGPDTTTRVKTVWQVKALPLANAADCEAIKERLRSEQELGISEWSDLIALPQGSMNARTQPDESDPDECLLPPSAGFQGLENQLYRVEVHTGGDRDIATFKWSRDNGSVTARIQNISGTSIKVHDTGRDDVLSFAADQWVEITGDPNELAEEASAGDLHQIASVNPATREIVLKTAPTPISEDALREGHYKLRRWDQSGDSATANGVSMTADWLALEHGIQVHFSDDDFRTGDYWLIPARTVTGEIEWPPYEIPNENPEEQLPFGIRHHYCPLALVVSDGNSLAVDDCRLLFPPLTDITAADVYFDDSNCAGELGELETVQEAIDALCARDTGDGCAVSISPSEDWVRILGSLDKGADVHICFEPGTYTTSEMITLADKGHILLNGAGSGTRLIADKAEAVFEFLNCDSVTVRDLYLESKGTGSSSRESRLNGTLTFEACPKVTIEDVAVKCAAGERREASCITVRDALTCVCEQSEAKGNLSAFTFEQVLPDRTVTIQARNYPPGETLTGFIGEMNTKGVGGIEVGTVQVGANGFLVAAFNIPQSLQGSYRLDLRLEGQDGSAYRCFCNHQAKGRPPYVTIQDCHLSIGHRQVGMLLINAERAYVVNNSLQVVAKPKRLRFDRIVSSLETRSMLRALLISDAHPQTEPPAGRETNVSVTVGDHMVHFNTDNSLVNAWQPLVDRELTAEEVTSSEELLASINDLADRALLHEGVVGASRELLPWLSAVKEDSPAVAERGIVVAGRQAQDINISNNRLAGVLQGIRVGVSHREASRGTPDQAGVVTITNNRIGVQVSPLAWRERYGVFIGNCRSLLVNDNHITLKRAAGTTRLHVQGIRVYGTLGKRMIARHNHLEGFSLGIFIKPLNPAAFKSPQWFVGDNVASVSAPAIVRQSHNYA